MKAALYLEGASEPALVIELPADRHIQVVGWGTKAFARRDPFDPACAIFRESIVLCCEPERYWKAPSGLPGEPTEHYDIDWENF